MAESGARVPPKKVEGPAVPVPQFPELEAALRDLVARGMTRVDEIKARLPAEMQVSAEQVRGLLDDILGHADWAALYQSARADVFRLITTGHSAVKHDPVNMA